MTNGNATMNNTQIYHQDMNSPAFNSRAQQYQNYFTNTSTTTAMTNPSPTDLSMKQSTAPLQMNSQLQNSPQNQPMPLQVNSQMQNLSNQMQPMPMQSNLQMANNNQSIQNQVPLTQQQTVQQQRPPILTHKLNVSASKQFQKENI